MVRPSYMIRVSVCLALGFTAILTAQVPRNPTLASGTVGLRMGKLAELWFYNPNPTPLKLKWRIVSGTESVCGLEPNGTPRRDCDELQKWPAIILGPERSDRLLFKAPENWFHPLKSFEGDQRDAMIEMSFGADEAAPLVRFPLKLQLHPRLTDAFVLWTPSWALVGGQLLDVTFWVTFGAVLLMLAQVMIPNFRQCLRMENDLESLQDRLRAISSRVGDRLYTRCHRELDSVRTALAMQQAASSGFMSLDRLALAGNTPEVKRIAAILPRIESRIGLTEQLDENQSIDEATDLGNVPPSFCWNRATELRNIQRILSRQFITDSDEKSAGASLDLLASTDDSLKDISSALEKRVVGIRRQLSGEPWKSSYQPYVTGLKDCISLLDDTAAKPAADGGWTTDELIVRDRAAVRLSIIIEMISLESLLNANPDVKAGVLKKLQSNDPFHLADARADLVKLSQGISEKDIEAALKGGFWDTSSEPTTVSDQDVLRVSLVFRNKDLDRCAAKESFQCFWLIRVEGNDAEDTSEVYETGWEAQLILKRGKITVDVQVFDRDGNPVTIRPDTPEGKTKGQFSFEVGPPPANALRTRLLRGLLDATITAVVPVITVAVTTIQNGVVPSVDKLILLGFTSQAIRAAVIPESTAAGAKSTRDAAAA